MLPKDPYGSFIFVKTDSGLTSGELLAAERDSVYIMSEGKRIVALADRDVLSARLVRFNPQAGGVAGLTMLGVLSTLSNGFGLIFTAPAWILVGTGATAARSHEPEMELHKHDWKPMLAYARFPAGLPPGFLTTPPPPPPPVVVEHEEPPAVIPPPEPVREEPPAPVSAADRRRFATHLGLGMGFQEDLHAQITQSGIGFIAGIDARIEGPLFLGTRVSMAHREASEDLVDPAFATSGESFDLALLIGLQGHVKRLRPGFGIGPAALGNSVSDVHDIDFSIALQGELMVDVAQNIAVGALGSYNQNSKRDFYVIALGIRFVFW
jgi:hypothetical protein